jgi:hypothetical protein
MSHRHRVFVDAEVIRGRPLQQLTGHVREKAALRPRTQSRALMCYCVRNLYVTIRATMLAKISSAARDFRIIGPVELRAADEAG